MIALTHKPSSTLHTGARTYVDRSLIDFNFAQAQHAAYEAALRACGATVITLDVNASEPDGTFLEDTAIVLNGVAVICSMGAASRRNEPGRIAPILSEYRDTVRIESPATIEGGDVLRVGRRLFVGQSCRTNAAGLAELAAIAKKLGYDVTPVNVHGCLHLKTACTALPDGGLLLNSAWLDKTALHEFDHVEIPAAEPWAANVCLVNDNVIAAAAHPQTRVLIERLGFVVRPVDLSEFAKCEAGVTCLSLLINPLETNNA